MKTAVIPSSWIHDEGHRLDPKPFAQGTVALHKSVTRLPHVKLRDVTEGFKGGIFTHLFSPKRTYVADPRYGVPFLGASSMQLADLTRLPLLSNKDAESRSYAPLKIREGMTLISCSGSVGRVAYARSDMDGMASAGDILKVQPAPDKIPPGYLYAFLSSRPGQLLVSGGTYGTIVQHLEPEHVSGLPVPRLDLDIEQSVNRLIVEAAQHRVEASRYRTEAIGEMTNSLGWGKEPL